MMVKVAWLNPAPGSARLERTPTPGAAMMGCVEVKDATYADESAPENPLPAYAIAGRSAAPTLSTFRATAGLERNESAPSSPQLPAATVVVRIGANASTCAASSSYTPSHGPPNDIDSEVAPPHTAVWSAG